jgi:hypothetical protein
MRAFTLLALLGLAACTTLDVRRLPPQQAKIDCVCINKNNDVNVDDFVSVLQEGFDRHGIATKVIEGTVPRDCHYVLTYTADRWWDLAPYMVDAHLTITKDGQFVGSGHYHLFGHGGLDLAKYEGTSSKLNPVIDAMLKDIN